jgi:hypothetical protein
VVTIREFSALNFVDNVFKLANVIRFLGPSTWAENPSLHFESSSMPLFVHAFGAYATYTNERAKWRNEDHNVRMLVKAIKREEFRGFARMQDRNGQWKRFNFADPAGALELFADWAVHRIRELNASQCVLVPIPSSRCTHFADDTPPLRMAMAVHAASRKTFPVAQWLRFGTVMAASHDGGRRDQGILESALIVSPDVRPANVVLVDDVKTTGAHARACAQVLRRAGATVSLVLVAGAATQTPVADPFAVDPTDIEFVSGGLFS